MISMITMDVLESFLFCRYKGYLKWIGHQGIKSDYEVLLAGARDEVRLRVIEKLITQHRQDQTPRGVTLNNSVLKQGLPFILGTILEDSTISLSLEGLKKAPGPSKLGDFHYIPMLFQGEYKIRKEHRLMLEMCGLLLSRHQGTMPSNGIIWHGGEGKATKIRMNSDPGNAKRLLKDLQETLNSEAPPKLILKDHCQVCEFRARCHDQAVQEDNLSLLRGMSEKEIKKLGKKGIFTITQLAHTFRPRRKGKREAQTTNRRHYALQAMAIRDKKIYILGKPELPTSGGAVYVYLDIEGDPEADFIYLIGMVIVKNGQEKSNSFWADRKDQESKIFERFVSEISLYDNFLVFCYGSYELDFLKRMRKGAKKKKLVDKILNASVNILSLIYPHIYFPTHSNGLKNIGSYLGSSWTETDASGIQSIVWRRKWEVSGDEDWKQKLVTYNFEDCAALKKVVEVVHSIIAKTGAESALPASEKDDPPVAFVKDVERLTDFYTWGRVNFVHTDYEYINKCAYFDYQRERVYVRTSKTIRKNAPGKKKSLNRNIRASEQFIVTASRCPACKDKEVTSGVKKQIRTQEPRVKRAFDLSLTPGGIKRKVIEVRTSIHQCRTCGEEFVPEQHQRLDKHFHGLKSWAMFQHVEHRTSLETIGRMIEEFFGIQVRVNEIHMFKSLIARYYKPTYQRLLKKILSGNLLHVDETEVRLQTGKGYVWVFTNLEEVVFMFKPSRESGFLRELLRGFHGVLVTDFYAAYDAIECPQQKCLIHLMRDINQELLNNPFDKELQLITHPFGGLLRAIITTIDEYGLKRKSLKKHEGAVKNFFRSISELSIHSEAAVALRARLIKYKDKLFTFTSHDGVPWNNNNAEHAIKQFAYYRESTNGMLTETGMNDYLLLLSICQTCHYKGVSFLKFLLSWERDIDAYCDRPHRKRQSPATIELYPKGFVPPHLTYWRRQKLHPSQRKKE
jgi:predicted RecB family nuclease